MNFRKHLNNKPRSFRHLLMSILLMIPTHEEIGEKIKTMEDQRRQHQELFDGVKIAPSDQAPVIHETREKDKTIPHSPIQDGDSSHYGWFTKENRV